MSASHLHSKILADLRQANPREDYRRQKVCAWAITGLLFEKTVHLTALALVICGPAKTASRVRRLRRFLANPHVDLHAYYDGLLIQALREWAGARLTVVIDTTALIGQTIWLCRVSLVYRGRALPLAWKVYRGGACLAFRHYQPLLEHVLDLLPPKATVMALGDRAFTTLRFIDWCQDHHWHFRLRLKARKRVTFQTGQTLSMRDIRLRPGMVRFFANVNLGWQSRGTFHLALAWVDGPNAEPWYVLSDEPPSHQTLADYRLRMDIEESFRDDKSGGFQLVSGRLRDPESLERLTLVLAIATVYLLSLGTAVVEQGAREAVDKHFRRGLSYFQIGWRALRRMCYQTTSPVLPLRLSPLPCTAPVATTRPLPRLPWLACTCGGPHP